MTVFEHLTYNRDKRPVLDRRFTKKYLFASQSDESGELRDQIRKLQKRVVVFVITRLRTHSINFFYSRVKKLPRNLFGSPSLKLISKHEHLWARSLSCSLIFAWQCKIWFFLGGFIVCSRQIKQLKDTLNLGEKLLNIERNWKQSINLDTILKYSLVIY